MINRYAGETRINPIAILRNDDFNNSGEIRDIDDLLAETISIQNMMTDRLKRLKAYLMTMKLSGAPTFRFSEGGYIAMGGLSDQELIRMKSQGLIELYDYANERNWVIKHGAQFGLTWEGGRAIEVQGKD